MIHRRVLYSALLIAATGSFSLWIMKQPILIIGWLLGIIIGIVNFSSLLSSLNKTQSTPIKPVTGFQKAFFIRYLLLAGAFFLIIQMGRNQLGSAVIGFLSLYIALFLDYLFRFKKSKNAGS